MVNTRHIDKNGLSFDCPDYYDIGKYPSSDKAHKSMVALSKHDRRCEIYITVYRKNAFDNNAKRNMSLLQRYLQLHNYKNITINNKLPYCFNATVSHQMGNIKTTIVYNFDHDDVIMIVGNLMPSSNYDCCNDIKIILDTLQQGNIIKRMKQKITSRNKTIIGLITIILTIIITLIGIEYYPLNTVLPWMLPALFLIIPSERIKSSKFLSIISIILVITLFFVHLEYDFSIIPDLIFGVFDFYYIDYLICFILHIVICFISLICALMLYISTDDTGYINNVGYCTNCNSPITKINNVCDRCGSGIDYIYSLKKGLLYSEGQSKHYEISKEKAISWAVFFVSGFLFIIRMNGFYLDIFFIFFFVIVASICASLSYIFFSFVDITL